MKWAGRSGSFFLCQWPWKHLKMLAGLWFAAHPENRVLCDWSDWCWYFYCHSLAVLCYLCCLWFSDWTLRLNAPHGCLAAGSGASWSTEGQYTLAQIFGDFAESQRPLSFTPVTCSLTGVHQMLQAVCSVPCMSSSRDIMATLEQRVRMFFMVLCLNVIWLCIAENKSHLRLLISFDDASVSGLSAIWWCLSFFSFK